MKKVQLKNLSEMLKDKIKNNDNLHRIAISNLRNDEKRLIRWWCNHYRTPPKPLDDYTLEEIFIEQLENHYLKHPDEMINFLPSPIEVDDWDGEFSEETEKQLAKMWSRVKTKKVDLSRYQKGDVSDEEAEEIISNLGKNLPNSKKNIPVTDDEFDDFFE